MSRKEQILKFIDNFVTNLHRQESSPITSLFGNGYCYYFALILRDAFGGEIVWPKYHGHIVWHDINDNLCYDIYGLYTDWTDTDLIPMSVLGPTNLAAFKHIDESSVLTDDELFAEQGRVNAYEYLRGWNLSRYIEGDVIEFPIKRTCDEVSYVYDIESATLITVSQAGLQTFAQDNDIPVENLSWIKVVVTDRLCHTYEELGIQAAPTSFFNKV